MRAFAVRDQDQKLREIKLREVMDAKSLYDNFIESRREDSSIEGVVENLFPGL